MVPAVPLSRPCSSVCRAGRHSCRGGFCAPCRTGGRAREASGDRELSVSPAELGRDPGREAQPRAGGGAGRGARGSFKGGLAPPGPEPEAAAPAAWAPRPRHEPAAGPAGADLRPLGDEGAPGHRRLRQRHSVAQQGRRRAPLPSPPRPDPARPALSRARAVPAGERRAAGHQAVPPGAEPAQPRALGAGDPDHEEVRRRRGGPGSARRGAAWRRRAGAGRAGPALESRRGGGGSGVPRTRGLPPAAVPPPSSVLRCRRSAEHSAPALPRGWAARVGRHGSGSGLVRGMAAAGVGRLGSAGCRPVASKQISRVFPLRESTACTREARNWDESPGPRRMDEL